MTHVLVLGGGFSGIEAAIQLREAGLEVTLVSDRSYVFINPIAIWIPTGDMPFEQATVPLDELARVHGFTFRQASVLEVRSAEHKVLLDDGELACEYLVVALGASKLRPKGVEHTRSICSGPESGWGHRSPASTSAAWPSWTGAVSTPTSSSSRPV
jgi:sulfide:quinone oxidoreductase